MTKRPEFYNPRDPEHRSGAWVEVIVTLGVLVLSALAFLTAGGGS